MNSVDIRKMTDKRIVFIVDEAHRSTFGNMLIMIKQTFSGAIFFGFTGTPRHIENKIKGNTTADVFGDELHRYSIADGIRDKNVLGFDPYMVLTYRDKDVRKVVALYMAKAANEKEAIADPAKRSIYYYWLDKAEMTGNVTSTGNHVKGVEDYLPTSQYIRTEHQTEVIKDIRNNWYTLSHGGKFHAIFATNSILEAIQYYRLIKKNIPEIKCTALFDPNIDNDGCEDNQFKEDGLVEIIKDYNVYYNQTFELSSNAKFKKDIAARLAHKGPYRIIEREPDKCIDLLIVVDQMLTGFDSKWINTLYMDKLLEYQNIIQAFSRTNRLFGYDKPFGTIRYYRKPHTMKKNIEEAVKLYSGDKPIGLFVQKLEENLNAMNQLYREIAEVFSDAGVPDFTKNPDDNAACGRFAKLFREFNDILEAAKIQGFTWDKQKYVFQDKPGAKKRMVETIFDENAYLILALRYKELFSGSKGGKKSNEDAPLTSRDILPR